MFANSTETKSSERENTKPSENHRQDKNDDPLQRRNGRAAERPADHDIQARYRRHQGLFQKSKLPVPNELDAGKDRGENDAHADNARREEIKIIPLPCFRKNRTKPVAQREQKQERLTERADYAGLRPEVPLQFPQPHDVNGVHGDCISE